MSNDLLREARDEARKRIESLDVHDAIALLEHIPDLVRWFRHRRYSKTHIAADIAAILGDIHADADAARAALRERLGDKSADETR
jgi:hypothetical protein